MKSRPALFIILWLIPAIGSSQQQIFVNPNATGLNDGTNWQNAYTDLGKALVKANNVDIFIAEGTYVPYLDKTGKAAVDPRRASFMINCGVRLKGGYHIVGHRVTWSLKNKTIFSGDVQRNDVGTISNPAFYDPSRQDNVYQLLYLPNGCAASSTKRFEAIEFTGAENPSGACLGSYLSTEPDSMAFVNCRFYLNAGTEGLMVRHHLSSAIGRLLLDSCSAEQNNIDRFIKLSFVWFQGKKCNFTNSYKLHAIFAEDTAASKYCAIKIDQCIFYELSLTVATFRTASAGGGEIRIFNSKFYIKSTLVDWTSGNGTAITNGVVLLFQCLVSKDNGFPSSLLKLNLYNALWFDAYVQHCTINSYPASNIPFIVTNRLVDLPLPWYYHWSGVWSGFYLSVIWGFTGPFGVDNLQGNQYNRYYYFHWCNAQNFSGLNHHLGLDSTNITTNPMFIAPLGTDGLAGTPDDNLHVMNDYYNNIISPCIDGGTLDLWRFILPVPALDIDGEQRVQGIIDYGCYERCRCAILITLLRQTNPQHSKSAWPQFAQWNN